VGSPLKGFIPLHVYDIVKKKEVTGIEVAQASVDAPKSGVLLAVSPDGRKAAVAVMRDKMIDTVELHDLPE
jgi:hypothetical protein